jgi:hypothetical protein
MKEMLPIKVWGVVTNHTHLRLEHIMPTRLAASERMRWLDKQYPRAAGTRRIVRLKVIEIEEEERNETDETEQSGRKKNCSHHPRA